MANNDQPNGFAPYGRLLRATEWEAGAAVYPGDLVKLSSDGQIDACSAGDSAIGVCLSYASAQGTKVLVADHPDQLFVVQASASDIDTQTDIGNNFDILATAANTVYKVSRQELASSTAVTTISAQLQLVNIEPMANNAFGANVKCIVRINEHQLAQSLSAGV